MSIFLILSWLDTCHLQQGKTGRMHTPGKNYYHVSLDCETASEKKISYPTNGSLLLKKRKWKFSFWWQCAIINVLVLSISNDFFCVDVFVLTLDKVLHSELFFYHFLPISFILKSVFKLLLKIAWILLFFQRITTWMVEWLKWLLNILKISSAHSLWSFPIFVWLFEI